MSPLIAPLFGMVLLMVAANAADCTGAPRGDRRCGAPAFGNAQCYPGYCCSIHYWCGNTRAHCEPDICRESGFPSVKAASNQRAMAPAGPNRVEMAAQRPPPVSGQRGVVSASAMGGIGARVSISSMSSSELRAYRDAWAVIMKGGQSSIYYQIALDHGVPRFFCPHGSQKFLPWHRRYINRLEKALGVPLAFWDWTQEGIPRAFSESTYVNSQGETVPNPLFNGILPSGQLTSRRPNMTPDRYRAVVAFAQRQTRFSRFASNIESVHDNVHGSIGNTMAVVSLASFDPIFWAHHCFVDYQWWIWQLNHANAEYNSMARGELKDSAGTFLGAAMIEDQSGWLRGRPADQFPRASTSSIFSEPQLFLNLKSVSSFPASTELSVFVEDICLAKDIRFGMHGMTHHIQKDLVMYVDPKDAEKVWVEKKIGLDQIPERAEVWLTRDGEKVRKIEGVEITHEWMT